MELHEINRLMWWNCSREEGLCSCAHAAKANEMIGLPSRKAIQRRVPTRQGKADSPPMAEPLCHAPLQPTRSRMLLAGAGHITSRPSLIFFANLRHETQKLNHTRKQCTTLSNTRSCAWRAETWDTTRTDMNSHAFIQTTY